MVLLLGPHPDRRFYLLFHSRKMNRFYIFAFYFVINDIQASSDSDLNLEMQLDIVTEEKSHEECPNANAEHKTEGHGHGLHDLPGKFPLQKEQAQYMLYSVCILKAVSSKTH